MFKHVIKEDYCGNLKTWKLNYAESDYGLSRAVWPTLTGSCPSGSQAEVYLHYTYGLIL